MAEPTPEAVGLSNEECTYLRTAHVRAKMVARCLWCGFDWPCPTTRLLAQVARLAAERDVLRAAIEAVYPAVAGRTSLLEQAEETVAAARWLHHARTLHAALAGPPPSPEATW